MTPGVLEQDPERMSDRKAIYYETITMFSFDSRTNICPKTLDTKTTQRNSSTKKQVSILHVIFHCFNVI